MTLEVGVRDLRRKGASLLEVVERVPTPRLGYRAITYHRCEYRLQFNGRPFIDVADPIRCRGEKWEKPAGRERRVKCAGYKRSFKFSRTASSVIEARCACAASLQSGASMASDP